MKHFLIAVDLQTDFVDGSLGTPEAVAMKPCAVEKIRGFDGEIFATLDTHSADYLSTAEGKQLPVVHCVRGTPGWALDADVRAALYPDAAEEEKETEEPEKPDEAPADNAGEDETPDSPDGGPNE